MTIAFKKKNLEKLIILGVILVVTCFSIDPSSLVTAQSVPVTFIISPIGAGSITTTPPGAEFPVEYTSQTTLNIYANYSFPVTAASNSGYIFTRWQTSNPSITFANTNSASTTVTVNGAGTITATFTPQYQVTFATSGGGSSTISPSGTHNYTAGQQVPVNVTIVSGYSFVSWSASTGSITFANSASTSTTATINAAGSITANFVPLYSVLFAANGGGSSTTSPSGTQIYTAGKQVTITANPASGYSLISWNASTPAITFANSRAASTTASINGSGTITAFFNQSTYPVLFANSGGGTSTTSPSGTQTYGHGQIVPINVSVATGYSFMSWNATGSIIIANPTLTSTTATINGAGTITATFNQSPYQVSFATRGGGSSKTSPSGSQTYTAGQRITITANAANGYRFISWSSSGSITFTNSSSPITTATINTAGTITATFDATINPITCQVSFTTKGGVGSTISPSGTQTYTTSQQITVTANSGSGYVFANWSASPSGSASFDNANSATTKVAIQGSCTITAYFTQVPPQTINYQVTFATSDVGSTVPSGTQTFFAGQQVSVHSTPKAGYSFSSWSASPSSAVTFADASSESTTATILSSAVISAEFTQNTTLTPTPTSTTGSSPTNTTGPSILDVVEVSAVIIIAAILSIGAGYYLSYALRPSLKKFGRDLQNRRAQETKNEEQEDKDKERDKKKKKPFLKLEIKVPLMLWGSKSALAEGKVVNQGISSAQDILVSAIAAPGLVLNKRLEKIPVLKPLGEKSLSFPFIASNRIKRGNYKLRFEIKSKQTSRRIKDRSLRAMKIGFLSDNEGRRNLVCLKSWLGDRAVTWDELSGADNLMKLLEFDLLVMAYESEMPLKWIKNISNFVDESQSLLVINTINTSNIDLISQTLGYTKMAFEDFKSAERSLIILDNHHEATKTLHVGKEIPLSGRIRICTSNIEKGLNLAKQTIRNLGEETQSKDFPAIVANNYGNGRAIYLNFCLEQTLPEKNEIFENIFNWLIFKNSNCLYRENSNI